MLFYFCFVSHYKGQNEATQWYFGNQAGLNFLTNPPTILTNGVMNVTEGCSSIANSAGALLFYTDGITVYNSMHQVMANGTGLLGNFNPSQSSIIIKQPGSTTLYYIFTVQGSAQNGGCHYSIVDMALAAGQGSVTVKNSPIYTGSVGEKLTATKHCNGVDYWILIRDWTQNQATQNFRAYQLTSAGVNTTPVLSPSSSWWNSTVWYYDIGCMKISPNGKKLGLAVYNYNNQNTNGNHAFELYDFDNNTGVITNSIALNTWTNTSTFNNYGYGCEFSPDGTKFYGSSFYNTSTTMGGVFQWDLCAGSPGAIVASSVVVGTATNSTNWFASMQLAPNGKIYIATWNGVLINAISFINTPNAAGVACGFSYLGQSIAPKISYYGLPNFVGSHFVQPPPAAPFTYTVSNVFGCQGVGFTTPVTPNTTISACSMNGFSLTSLAWNFGDPGSGSANVSFASNPVHAFTNLGTYTVQLILYYSCGGGTDTLRQIVNVNQPCISVNSSSITCANLGSATVQATGGVGPFSYTWMPGNQTSSVATGLSPGTYTLTVFDFGNNFTYTATTLFTSLIPLTGNINAGGSLTCNGAATSTGNITNLAGGSGSQNYAWYNNTTTLTTASVNNLSAGIWSVSVIDAVTGCSLAQSFYIAQPPPMNLNLSTSSPSVCVNTSVTLSGVNSGGTPGLLTPYSYTWTGGPVSDTYTTTRVSGGTYVYTLSSSDSLHCITTKTIVISFVNNPLVSVNSVSVCPLKTGSLTASGASTYTWSNAITGAVLTSTTIGMSVFTVTGSALGCSTSATASIGLYPLPSPTLASNSPVCNSQLLQLQATGGQSYFWTGPQSYTSNISLVNLNNANPLQSGLYTVLVTSAVGCTVSAALNATVHPTPTLSATGSTVCSTGTISLNAYSGATAFAWSGPGQFNSALQNPFRYNISVALTGFYTVNVASAHGCTNSAVVHVSVTQVPVPSASANGPLCAGSTVNFNATGADTYLWTGPNGFNANVSNPVITGVPVAGNGIYTLMGYRGPCAVPVTQSLLVYPLPAPSASSTPIVCETKTLGLFASCSGTINYVWTGPNSYNSPTQNPVRLNANPFYSGTYTVLATDNFGCQSIATTSVNILQNPTLTALGTTVCLNQAGIIKVTGASSYFWLGPDYFQSSVQNPTIAPVTHIREGTYTVVGTAANTCTSVTTVMVATKVLPIPKIELLPKKSFCPGEAFTLLGSGGAKYEWYGPLALQFAGESFTHTLLHEGEGGTYTLIAEDGTGCRNSETIFIQVNALPQGRLVASEKTGCVPFCAKYEFKPISAAKINSEWNVGLLTYTGSFSHCFYEDGDLVISGTMYDPVTTCSSKTTFDVKVYARPEADFRFEPTNPIENDEVFFQDMSSGEDIVSWKWAFSDLASSSSKTQHFSLPVKEPGYLTAALVVKNVRGCSDTIVKSIRVEEDLTVYVPNAFTPNDDQLNETFLPQLRGVKKYYLQVYDRWGKMVYEGNETDAGWDGTLAGVPCKSDVYTWRLQVTALSGENKLLTGHVTLLK